MTTTFMLALGGRHTDSHAKMSADTTSEDGKLFAQTRWSLVAQAREPEKAERALAELCQIYWYPVYAYIRSLGKGHHDAQDLAQGTFEYLLGRDDFAKLDAEKGRLRTYLCVAAKRYVYRAARDQGRLKRGGGTATVSLDADEGERRYREEPHEGETPETLFDRSWATALIEETLSALEGEYHAKDRAALFEELRPYVCAHSQNDLQREAAARLGIKVGTFAMSVARVRQRYGEILRQTVADTLTDPSKADEELAHLLDLF